MTNLIKYVIGKCYKTLKHQKLINVSNRNEIFLQTRIYFNFSNFLLRKVGLRLKHIILLNISN